MANKEIIFEGIPGSRVWGRELHVTLGDDKRVEWWVVPVGDQGYTRPLEDSQIAARFIADLARRLGFRSRPEDVNPAEVSKHVR